MTAGVITSALFATALGVIAFLLGSIPFGVLIARRRGIDIRTVGSGNIGATNVARALGARTGAVVLLLDALKGALPVAIVRTADLDASFGPTVAITGFAAILGHCYTPFLRFRGGKGVATALGVFLVAAPFAALAGIAAFALIYLRTRVAALGSIAGSLTVALVACAAYPLQTRLLALATFLLILAKHRRNLANLRSGPGTPTP